MKKLESLVVVSAFVAFSLTASGGDMFAIRSNQKQLYKIDTTTFTATLVGNYTLADPNQTGIGGLSFGANHVLYGLASAQFSGSLYSVDPTTAATTVQWDLFQPVGVLGMDRDPADGSIWWINTGGFNPAPQLYSVDPATGALSPHGNVGPGGFWFAGAVFDDLGNLYAVDTTSTLWTVDKQNPQSNSVRFAAPLGGGINCSQGATLTYSASLNQVVGYAIANRALFSVDLVSGTGQMLHQFPAGVPQFAAIGEERCSGEMSTFGAGCAGSGGFVPNLEGIGCASPGRTVVMKLSQALGGSTALLVFGIGQGNVPMGGGCSLLVAPLLPPIFPIPLNGSGAGAGGFELLSTMPALPLGTTITTQALVIDPAAFIGGAASNGLEIDVN